jgi:hypothetical protein
LGLTKVVWVSKSLHQSLTNRLRLPDLYLEWDSVAIATSILGLMSHTPSCVDPSEAHMLLLQLRPYAVHLMRVTLTLGLLLQSPLVRATEQVPSIILPTDPAANTSPENFSFEDLLPLRLEIQLARRQVTVYLGETPVKRYPIAIGRPGWETPIGSFKVLEKIKDPTWVNPFKKGVVIPGGDPENPLGRYWIGFWTDGNNWIGFHGTPNPHSVGNAASHGCIRMYNKDVEELFQKVKVGTVVTVIP